MSIPFLEKIEKDLVNWPGEFATGSNLVKLLNPMGKNTPVFWCFQSAQEFESLANALGQDTPLYALRSGHLLMEYTEDNINSITTQYASEVAKVCDAMGIRIPLLAGNCQGSGLILHVVKKLEKQGTPPLGMVALESTLPQRLSSPVTLIFGRNSSYNLFRRYHSIAEGIQKYYDKVNIVIIPGRHGQFFSKPNVPYIAAILKKQFHSRYQTLSINCARESITVDETPRFTCKALEIENVRIHSTSLSAHSKYNVTVEIKNPTELTLDEGKLHISNHWYKASDRTIHQWLDARVALHEFTPNTTQFYTLEITTPFFPGDFVLKFRFSEEGLDYHECEFEQIIAVTVLPFDCNIAKTSDPKQRKRVFEAIRQGCTDKLMMLIADQPALTTKQWQLIAYYLTQDERWFDAAILYDNLLNKTRVTLSILQYAILSYLGKQDAQKVINTYGQHNKLHHKKNPTLNQYYLEALLIQSLTTEAFEYFNNKDFVLLEPARLLQTMLTPHLASSISKETRFSVAETLIKIDHSLEAYLKASAVFISANNHSRAKTTLIEGCNRHPHNATLALRAARISLDDNDNQSARLYYNKVVSLSPHNPEALNWVRENTP